jgi:hypothetical protein
MIVIVDKIEPSNRKNKRYVAVLSNGDKIHFGQKNAETYIDHKNNDLRINHLARHYWGREKELIDNLTISPAVLSAYVLWGYYDSIDKNLKYLNDELAKKHSS